MVDFKFLMSYVLFVMKNSMLYICRHRPQLCYAQAAYKALQSKDDTDKDTYSLSCNNHKMATSLHVSNQYNDKISLS